MFKRVFILLLLIMIWQVICSVSVDAVWNSKDVLACSFYDDINLIDLQTGNEVNVYHDEDLLDFTWNKTGNKIYTLSDVHTDGENYDDPGYDTIIIRSMTFPIVKPTILTQIRVKSPLEDYLYVFSNLYLNKEGNLTIVLTYNNYVDYAEWHYVYNFATAKLSAPVKKKFNFSKDTFKYKGLPMVTNQPGKYSLDIANGKLRLYTDAFGTYPEQVTDINQLYLGTIALDETLYYCVSKDSTRILFGYNTDEVNPFGPTYAITVKGEKLSAISYDKFLGYDYQPWWMSDNRLVYLAKGASGSDNVQPSINILDTAGDVTVLTKYENDEAGPQKIMYRYQSK